MNPDGSGDDLGLRDKIRITYLNKSWLTYSYIFRAPKPKHIKEGHNIGHVLNKRRQKHFKEGPYTKPSATLRFGSEGFLRKI